MSNHRNISVTYFSNPVKAGYIIKDKPYLPSEFLKLILEFGNSKIFWKKTYRFHTPAVEWELFEYSPEFLFVLHGDWGVIVFRQVVLELSAILAHQNFIVTVPENRFYTLPLNFMMKMWKAQYLMSCTHVFRK